MTYTHQTRIYLHTELVKAYNLLNGWNNQQSVKHIMHMQTQGHTLVAQHAWVAKQLGA